MGAVPEGDIVGEVGMVLQGGNHPFQGLLAAGDMVGGRTEVEDVGIPGVVEVRRNTRLGGEEEELGCIAHLEGGSIPEVEDGQ